MFNDFRQIAWDARLEQDWNAILRLAIAEDLGDAGDRTSLALVAEDAVGWAVVQSRRPGVVAGIPGAAAALAAVDPRLRWKPRLEDGCWIEAGGCLGAVEGPTRGLLAAERIVLNLLGHLSGIATLTRQYVDAVAGTKARIYDTRKTTPGWRRLEKYAVRCGGGWNHRGGLDEAILIKDNHLAVVGQVFNPSQERQVDVGQVCNLSQERQGDVGQVCNLSQERQGDVGQVCNLSQERQIKNLPHNQQVKNLPHDPQLASPLHKERCAFRSPAEAVQRAKQYVRQHAAGLDIPIEVEVDTLQQLDAVLAAGPDLVLLDNMGPMQLTEAVAMRDARNPAVVLEASGGIDLDSVRVIAETGVDRISVGALTHSAPALDIGLDWPP